MVTMGGSVKEIKIGHKIGRDRTELGDKGFFGNYSGNLPGQGDSTGSQDRRSKNIHDASI